MQETGIDMAGQHLNFSGYKTVSTEPAKSMGVVRTEKGEKPGNSFQFAKDINNFINKVAVERKTGPTVNVFWLKDSPDKDTLFIQVPLIPDGSQKEIPSLAVALQTDPKTREIITQLLTAPGITQEALKEYIKALLEPSGTKIDSEKIDTTKIASLPDSGNKLALAATNRGTTLFSDKLAEPFKPQVKIVALNHQKKEVPELGAPTSTPLMPVMARKTEPAIESEPQIVKEKRRLIEVKTEDEKELQEIDRFITNRRVRGKFRGEVYCHGKTFVGPDHNSEGKEDYEIISEQGINIGETLTTLDSKFKFQAFDAHNVRRGETYVPREFDFRNSLKLIYLEDPKNPGITRLVIQGPNTQMDAAGRSTYNYSLICDLPTDKFKVLKELIVGDKDKVGNPNNAEKFIQIAFDGIDTSDIGRIPVEKFYLIDLNNYIPDIVSKTSDGRPTNLIETLNEARKNKLFNTNAVIYREFSRPLPDFN